MYTSFGHEAFAGIVLAGGNSSRMGRRKALLPFRGTTLLAWQVQKLRQLGLDEILISGPHDLSLPGTTCVEDIYSGCGPLGGLQACLAAASRPYCLVLAVDTPLVPLDLLAELCEQHDGGVTVVEHDHGKLEPLIAVYDRALAAIIERRIVDGAASIRFLQEEVPWKHVPYRGPEALLDNCNTPEDYRRMLDERM